MIKAKSLPLALSIIIFVSLINGCSNTNDVDSDREQKNTPALQDESPSQQPPDNSGTAIISSPDVNAPPVAPSVILVGERWKHIVPIENGHSIVLDIPTDEEKSEYVAKVWDEEQNDFIDGYEEIRAAVVDKAEQTYEFDGVSLKTIPRTGFIAKLTIYDMEEENLRSDFDWLFYSVTTSSGKSYVLPSDWQVGDDPAVLSDTERSAMYVSTSLGIWRITADQRSVKITSDEYNGMHSSWHEKAAFDNRYGMPRLFWIAHATLSPDRRYIIYQTNRDCYNEDENTSIWRIDLQTGEEQRLVEGNADNTINGFVTDSIALIDEQFLLEVTTGKTVPVTFPDLPNRSVIDTGFGYVACYSYKEEDAGQSSVTVFSIDTANAELTEIITERGYFSDFGFSPYGKYASVGYGTDPNQGVTTVMIFDFEAKTIQMLEEKLGGAYNELSGAVIRSHWLADNAMLLNVQSVVDNKGVFKTWLVQW